MGGKESQEVFKQSHQQQSGVSELVDFGVEGFDLLLNVGGWGHGKIIENNRQGIQNLLVFGDGRCKL